MSEKERKSLRSAIDSFLVKLDPARLEEAQRKINDRPKVKLAGRIGLAGAALALLVSFWSLWIGVILFILIWFVVVFLMITSGD